MAHWWQWTIDAGQAGDVAGLARKIDDLERRVAKLEKAGGQQQHAVIADGVKWYGAAGDGGGHHNQDLATWTGQAVPFVSTVARITGELTSTAFAKQTWGDAVLFSLIGGLLGSGVALAFEQPWTLAPIGAGIAFCVTGSVLIVHRRALLGHVVKAQADKSKRRGEMVIKLDRGERDTPGAASFLYVKCDITAEQVKEFARRSLDGESLAVHRWTGVGGCFTRAQFDSMVGELELAGLMRPAAGNTARSLTGAGRGFCRAVLKYD